ncbi:unnamed protein product [Onchocerca flexuosa]|uniref:START domain-containing protein n=1 Tax=Onchocerca flexuosa TaxID=387005 RepID=A0A183HW16_9BILA|nr:unnamed protein product [Onchocerca flexuosa]
MKFFRKLVPSLSDIAEEDNNSTESSSKSRKYSNLILPSRSSDSWKNITDRSVLQQQQRFIHLKQCHNDDTIYLTYNLWDETYGTTYKIDRISCNLEYSLSLYQQNGNDIVNNNNDNNDNYTVKGIDENTAVTKFVPQTAIRIFISPVFLYNF